MPHGRSPHHKRAANRRRARVRSDSVAAPDAADEVESLGPVRLQKLLAAAGFGSRRGSEALLRDGRVTVNGKLAQLGDSADPQHDDVAVDGERLERQKPAYWVLHKPPRVVTTVRDPQGRKTVMNLLPNSGLQLHPVGRLDYDSSGLVLMTNDGALTHALLHPSLGNEREYEVTVRRELDTRAQRALASGVVLEEGRTSRGRVDSVRFDPDAGTTTFHLTLVEGRNRQIRRSLLALGFPVKKLVRVRMGPLRLGKLPRGKARALRPEEIRALQEHARKLREDSGGRRARRAALPRGPRPSR